MRGLLAVILLVLPSFTAGNVLPRDDSPDLAADLLAVARQLNTSQPASDVAAVASAIQAASTSLDAVTSSGKRAAPAALVCKALKFVFPGGYVDASNATAYSAEEDVNW